MCSVLNWSVHLEYYGILYNVFLPQYLVPTVKYDDDKVKIKMDQGKTFMFGVKLKSK